MTVIEVIAEPINARGERAAYANEKYGTHGRNTFDIWLAKAEKPTPLVIYIHGGGFTGGDKSRYFQSEDVLRFLDAGVSIATINYRFMNEPPYGILASMNDSKRFVQYIRFNAKKYNIDKSRIACTGGSAGAGTALWLAFSDDMADESNNDPVLRESTRLTCAGAFATQATYDIFQWDEILGFPLSQTSGFLQMVARAFGFKSAENRDLTKETQIRSDLDFLAKMDKNSSPVYIHNRHKAGIPDNSDDINHHPLHAKKLKEKAEQVGLEAIVYAPEIGIMDPSGKDLVDFFLEKLAD
ncbi:MAG: esterase/lipase-like [Prolixibacteraceae bacterium]|nr:MAG: esterase/lipase-like [Prolixibacteraceae bacterium]